MRPIALLVSLSLFVACRHSSDAPERADACRQQTLFIYPMSGETTLVEEDQYKHLVKEISDQIDSSLLEKLAELGKFQRVTNGQCTAGLRLETRMVSLIHKRRAYHFKISGRVVECGNEGQAKRFELEEDNKEISEVAGRLADAISNEVGDVQCSPPGETPPPPPPPPPPPN